MSEPNAIIDLHDKLKEQDKQIARELKDNNGLREVIGIYSNAFDKVKKLADSGGEMSEFKSILKDLHEEILKL